MNVKPSTFKKYLKNNKKSIGRVEAGFPEEE